ncbi:Gfo/Idh/MocA family oxidoreductase [bacterium]|nr:Gfo/Idh/MocA family oxidoreductase [bacterium]
MGKRKVRIGFVGVGNMGQCAHLKNYVTLPDCAVVALAELRPKLAAAVAARYGVPRVYATAAEMLRREQLDGIVASQPFDRHGQVIIPLYRSGLPVFTEKPLAASVAVARRMLTALRRGGSWHMVGYHKRSDPATMWVKSELGRLQRTKELGQLKYVRILMPAGDWIAGGFTDLVRTDEKLPDLKRDVSAGWDSPYIVFVNYYIHQVNLLRHLLGESYRVVFADKAGVLLVAESRRGVTGTIEMTPYRTTIDWQESALVAFEKGYLKLELPAPLAGHRPGRAEAYYDPGARAEPRTVVPQLPWIHAMRQQAINFVRAIRGEIKPLCDAAEALEDLKAAQAYIRLWKG